MTRVRAGLACLAFAAFGASLGGSLGCADRPAECAPALVDRQKKLDQSAGLYAIDARKASADVVERALAAAAAQDARFAVMRNYEAAQKLCKEADALLTEAASAVTRAEATAKRIAQRDDEAGRALGSLEARLALARGLADSGVVDADATSALRKLVQAGADAKRELDRARAEQRASGFSLPAAAFDAAADRAVGVIDEVRKTTLSISDQVAKRCRLRLSGEELAEATLRAHADWILLDVPGAVTRRIVILKLDRDKKTCGTGFDRPASAAGIQDLEGDLLTWKIPGTIEHRILVSFGKKSAWFLEGPRFVRYAHERSAGFSKACADAVTCGKPRASSRTLEASCDCAPAPGQRLLPSDMTKTGRYVWDGSRVNAEP